MDDEARGILGDPDATGEEIRRAWEQAAMAAVQKHRETGVPVATWDWEAGRVALIPADEILLREQQPVAVRSDQEPPA